jgi:putative copper resistance protein D
VNTASRTPTGRHGAAVPVRATRVRLGAVALLLVVPLVAVVALVASGELTVVRAGPTGLADPGVVTRWGLPVLRGLHDAAATMTIGLLAIAVVALPRTAEADRDLLGPLQVRAVRLAARWAAGWALLGAGVLLLTYSDVVGQGLARPGALDQLGTFVVDVEAGRLLAGPVLLVLAVAVGALRAGRVSTLAVLALVSLGALLPPALGGHSAGAAGHDTAVNTLVAHLTGVTAWAGGLAGLAVLRRDLGDRLPAAARRFSTLAGWCFLAVAVSGVAGAVVRVGHWPSPSTAYGALMIAKVVALVLLGVLGWYHRRRVLPALDRSPVSRATFARLVAGELVVMAVALGLGVALSRTPPL